MAQSFSHGDKKKLPFSIKLLLLMPIILLLAALIILFLIPDKLKSDLRRLSSEEYNSVFLSMYPIDNYSEDMYAYWRGLDTVVSSYKISNPTVLSAYFEVLTRSGNTIHTVYLGADPDKLSPEQVLELTAKSPGTLFEVILPHPSMEYWLSLSEDEVNATLNSYRSFADALQSHEGIAVYFFGSSEWLIANPANYENAFLTTEDISETLMLHSDREHGYCITKSTSAASIDALQQLINSYRRNPPAYRDYSTKEVVFFGDSVIGNYTDSTSIPEVFASLTGASVYNLGYGGGTLTQVSENDASFVNLLKAFLSGDASSIPAGDNEKPFFAGLTTYTSKKAANNDNTTGTFAPDTFVINYGLNDYFVGVPITSDDPYDVYTFSGAFRSVIETLRSTYPNAQIIVATPNFTFLFHYGTDYNSTHNHALEDYANALISLCEELDVALLDNYNHLPITEDNWTQYLADGTHPNETGRFLIGQRYAQK